MGGWHGREVNRAAWEELRRRVLTEAGHRCQIGIEGVCTGRAQSVDHIRPVAEGGAILDRNNCRAACNACNSYLGVRLGAKRLSMKQNKWSRAW
jgi:5-methylcytosine-specific restriction endonuclease McrA